MTARPIFSQGRGRPVVAAVALCMVLMAVVLSAGCAGGDCPQPKDVPIITKVSQNGTHIWTKQIDTGVDNEANDMIVTSDGNVVIAGSIATKVSVCKKKVRPNIIRFSGNGDLIWNRTFDDEGYSARKIIQASDGNFYTIFNNGKILKLNQSGDVLWSRSIANKSDYWSAIETEDNNILVAGPELLKIDPDGDIVWEKPIPGDTERLVNSILELNNKKGFLLDYLAQGPDGQPSQNRIDTFDPSGNLVHSVIITNNSRFLQNPVHASLDGYTIFYSNGTLGSIKTGILYLDDNGVSTGRKIINGSTAITLTEDDGSFFAEMKNQSIRIVKLNSTGIKEWENLLPYRDPQLWKYVLQVHQIPGDGYFILYEKHQQIDLSI
jgi:hypothetical protein